MPPTNATSTCKHGQRVAAPVRAAALAAALATALAAGAAVADAGGAAVPAPLASVAGDATGAPAPAGDAPAPAAPAALAQSRLDAAGDDHEDDDDDEDDHEDDDEDSVADLLRRDVRDGRVSIEGDHAAVSELILKRDLPIPYDYIETLMRAPNAFGPGPACIVCHSSSDPARSYRGLDLSTCDGIRTGSTEPPMRPLFVAGEDPKREILGRRLRNNRMPFGVQFDVPTDSPPILAIQAWIAAGAKNDDNFRDNVRKLFTTENTFAPDPPACSECHMSNQEPPSFHELDLTSWEGIMLGADSVAKGVDHATKVVIPGRPDLSGVLQHLTEDRMPPGIDPTEDRDHPNTQILFAWVKQGALCD